MRQKADLSHEELKRLSSYMNDQEKLLGQLRSGKLEDKLRRAAELMREGAKAVAAMQSELAAAGGTGVAAGDGALGRITVDDVVVHEGAMDVLLPQFQPGEGLVFTPVHKGRAYVLTKLPLTLQLSIQDQQKKALKKARDNRAGVVPRTDSDVWFDKPSTDWALDHQFLYRRGKLSSDWTASENYTFKVTTDAGDRTAELVRGLAQKNLDKATQAASGDQVEIDLVRLPAQRLKFEATGESLGWKCDRTLVDGTKRMTTIMPLERKARVTIILSIFSNN